MLKVGIIGMGKMGRIRLEELEKHNGFEVRVLCDVSQKIAEEFPGYLFEDQWEKLLSHDIDVIFVCAYNYLTTSIVCQCLEKGLHVFSEKPPGTSLEDVKAMMASEKKAPNQILKFGFNHRFHYGIMEAKAIVESKRYGEILWARGIYGKAGGLHYDGVWRNQKELSGGGILLDQGIHMLDILIHFFGQFKSVKSIIQQCYWKNTEVEDNAFALLENRDGKVAMLHSSATQWRHKFGLDLFLEDGYVCVNGILSSTRSYGEESVTFARKQFEDQTSAMGKPREETIFFDRDDSWKMEIEDFYDVITGKKETVVGSSQDAFNVMETVEKIYQEG